MDLLRFHAAELVNEWTLACVADLGRAPGEAPTDEGLNGARVHALIATAGPAVIAALVTVIEDPEQAYGPKSALTAVAGLLIDNSVAVATPVRQLTLLRQVLHGHAVERLSAALVGQAEHDLSKAVDALLEVCAVRAAERLEQAVFVDHLTGLWNRRALDRDLSRELAVAERHGQGVSLIRFDVDGLKRINDVRGHNDGDDALCRLAAALRAGLRHGDTAYRVGGNQFMALLPGMSQDGVALLVQRVRAGDPPAFSWGAASFPDEVTNRPSLLELVDRRLVAFRGTTAASPSFPGSARLAAAREAGALRSARGRRSPLVAAFLAGLLLGGASLASAATGGLPTPLQNAAHTALARIGVPVPSGDRTRATRDRDEKRSATDPSPPSRGRFLGDDTTPCTYPGGERFVGTHGQYVAANPDKADTPENERSLAARSLCGQPLDEASGDQKPPTVAKRADGGSSSDTGKPQDRGTVGSEPSAPPGGARRSTDDTGGRPVAPGGTSGQGHEEQPDTPPKTSAGPANGGVGTPPSAPEEDSGGAPGGSSADQDKGPK